MAIFYNNKLVILTLILGTVSGFTIPNRQYTNTLQQQTSTITSTSLFAQKKRRRRKDASPSSTNTPISQEEDELPDFDLVEDIDLQENTQPKSTSSPGTTSTGKSINVNDPSVMEAMRSTKGMESISGGASTKDLLRSRNRDLEEKLVVNEIKEDLPSLADYRQSKGSDVGKKAARREARIAAALEAKGNEAVEEESFLSKLPFVGKSDGEEKSPIKLLEEGTWACIYILVAWEIYINSPLFERQGSMPPVVFTDPMTMTFLP
ncbi:hypothetical protein CTEN210_14939 [Chaetoceros tenuissimus]|uniref:Uncharacterized protein n=1 Tax=Chaetoceros tenuissimus TaxID=426638 RepID=A0AAD3D627_9STRA|nr:hypothetical protein CTEN210_14939 [Chaetoceros tenuissimus]